MSSSLVTVVFPFSLLPRRQIASELSLTVDALRLTPTEHPNSNIRCSQCFCLSKAASNRAPIRTTVFRCQPNGKAKMAPSLSSTHLYGTKGRRRLGVVGGGAACRSSQLSGRPRGRRRAPCAAAAKTKTEKLREPPQA
jgi:hypothetical protein